VGVTFLIRFLFSHVYFVIDYDILKIDF